LIFWFSKYAAPEYAALETRSQPMSLGLLAVVLAANMFRQEEFGRASAA
jgi:hypothetical protein